MSAPLPDERRAEIRELLDRLPEEPWLATDCEGEVEVWQESALLNVRRDENGEVIGYRRPASFLARSLLYEATLDTWDRGEDDGEDDDLRRDVAEFLTACRNGLPALLAEVEQLRAGAARVRAAHPEADGRCTRCRMACDCWDQAVAADADLSDLEDLGLRWSECPHPAEPFPCPTIRALDGTDAVPSGGAS